MRLLNQNEIDHVSGALSFGECLDFVEDVLGYAWNLPNTIVGTAFGLVGHVIGEIGQELGLYDHEPEITFGHNAIQFENNPLMTSAMTIGNTIVYGPENGPNAPNMPRTDAPEGYTVGREEEHHTHQGELLGPFYLLAHVVSGIYSSIMTLIDGKPSEMVDSSAWHNYNPLEQGPMTGTTW